MYIYGKNNKELNKEIKKQTEENLRSVENLISDDFGKAQ